MVLLPMQSDIKQAISLGITKAAQHSRLPKLPAVNCIRQGLTNALHSKHGTVLQVYKEYRNFILNKYREDVKRRLTFTECRKLLAGKASICWFCSQSMCRASMELDSAIACSAYSWP